jgi:hypothetical protein
MQRLLWANIFVVNIGQGERSHLVGAGFVLSRELVYKEHKSEDIGAACQEIDNPCDSEGTLSGYKADCPRSGRTKTRPDGQPITMAVPDTAHAFDTDGLY